MIPESALLLTHDPAARAGLETQLSASNIRLTTVDSSIGALHTLSGVRPLVVFADARMPEGDCFAFLSALGMRSEVPPVVLLAEAGGFRDACAMARATGVDDCLQLPLDPDRLHLALARLQRMKQLTHFARWTSAAGRTLPVLIGESTAIRGLRDWIRQVGPTTAPILIEGEPGSGRRLLAHLLHHQGAAAGSPLIEVDALVCPPEQLEAAFLPEGDNAMCRIGVVPLAPNGTLVVNEVGSCSLNVQAGILRLLQQRPDDESIETTATAPLRLIATTSRPLDRLVARQQFLPELYFRLSILPVRVAPLRERREEIAALASHFAIEAARHLGRATPVISETCVETLRRHDWPGNVRELRTVIEGAVCRCRGTSISPEHLSPRLRAPEASAVPQMPYSFDEAGQYLTLAEVEKRHILATLDHFQDSRSMTAASLDISIRTLRNKLVEYRANAEKTAPAAANAA